MGCCQAKKTEPAKSMMESVSKAKLVTRVPLRRTIEAFPRGQSIFCVRVEGGVVYVAGMASVVAAFDLETGERLREYAGHHGKVYGLSLDHDTLVSGGEDKTVKLWDASTGQLRKSMLGHDAAVVAVLHSGTRVYSGGEDDAVREWDCELGVLRRSFRQHSGPVYALALLDARTLLSASYDTTVKLWDLESGSCLNSVMCHLDAVLCMDLGGGHLLTGGGKGDKAAKCWRINPSAPPQNRLARSLEMRGHDGSVRAVTHVGASRCVTGSMDGTMKEWDLSTAVCLRTLVEHDEGVYSLQYEDGLLVAGSLDGCVRVYDMHDSAGGGDAEKGARI